MKTKLCGSSVDVVISYFSHSFNKFTDQGGDFLLRNEKSPPHKYGLLLEPKHRINQNWATFGAQAGIFADT